MDREIFEQQDEGLIIEIQDRKKRQFPKIMNTAKYELIDEMNISVQDKMKKMLVRFMLENGL